MKPLEIQVKLKRDEAGVAAHASDMKKMEAATASQVAKADQATGSAMQNVAKLDRAKSVSAAKDQAAQNRFVAGMKQSGDAGVSAFNRIGTSSAVVQVGLSKAIELAHTLGQAMQEAGERYRKLTGNFVDQRDRLAELATVMGEQPDNNFTLKNARFNKQAGFKTPEGLEYRMQFQNSGAQFKGRNMTDEEYNQYEQQSAALIAARGFDPSNSGDLAGSLIGFKDRSKMGAGASEDALGKLNSGTAILGRGKGRNSVLVNQFSMAASAALNEDELKGTFTDSDEVATAVSVMAEKHDAAAAEMIRAASRGLRDFDGKAASLLKDAGVDAKTKFIDAIRKIAPIVEAQARAKGVKVEDILKDSFEDALTREAIGVAINRGVSGGLFDDREKFAAGLQGPKPALDAIDAFKGSERGQQRIADAGVDEAEGEQGAKNSRLSILRQQAVGQLTQEGAIGTTGSIFRKYANKIFSAGTYDSEEGAIRARQDEILARRAEAAGIKLPSNPLALSASAEEYNEYFNRQMDRITGYGGKPLEDATVNELKQVNQNLKAQNDLLKQMLPKAQTPPVGRQPAPPVKVTR